MHDYLEPRPTNRAASPVLPRPVEAHGRAAKAWAWFPTRKWRAALISGCFTIGAHAFGSDGWDGTEWAELFTLFSGLTMAYVTENHATPGGIPRPAPNTPESGA